MQLSAAAMRKRISRANKTEGEKKAVLIKKAEKRKQRQELLQKRRKLWREKYCKERSETTFCAILLEREIL